MKIFTIYDGRASFWQWDLGQRLTVCDDVCSEVHFWNGTSECALVCKVYTEGDRSVVNVPNVLLRSTNPVRVYAYTQNDGSEQTVHSEIFNVIPRTKPDDYVYTETEVWTAEKAVEKALQEAKDSGEFKGEPGPKGDPGVVKFVVVTELPQEDTENAIYLLPNEDSPEGNMFDEYIFVDGKWEKIGSASVAVNLDEYVKISDMDALVKDSVTTNTETLTAEEKAAACEWLGAARPDVWETIIDYTVPEDCAEVFLKTDINGNPFKLKEAVLLMVLRPLESGNTPTSPRCTVDGTVSWVYGAEHYAHGFPNTPSEGKYAYVRMNLVKTPLGVFLREYVYANNVDAVTTGIYAGEIGGRVQGMHESVDKDTLQSRVTEISAVGLGSYAVAVGKGTRIVLMGVRE